MIYTGSPRLTKELFTDVLRPATPRVAPVAPIRLLRGLARVFGPSIVTRGPSRRVRAGQGHQAAAHALPAGGALLATALLLHHGVGAQVSSAAF